MSHKSVQFEMRDHDHPTGLSPLGDQRVILCHSSGSLIKSRSATTRSKVSGSERRKAYQLSTSQSKRSSIVSRRRISRGYPSRTETTAGRGTKL